MHSHTQGARGQKKLIKIKDKPEFFGAGQACNMVPNIQQRQRENLENEVQRNKWSAMEVDQRGNLSAYF